MALMGHDLIGEITPAKESWSIVAKVFRLWFIPDFNRSGVPFSMEMVLQDEKGDKIHASVRRSLIYRFERDLREGLVYSIHFFSVGSNGGNFRTTRHQYKLNFQFATRVSLQQHGALSLNTYSFVPLADVLSQDFDSNFLVDIMGLMTGVGTEREYERNGAKTKMNVIELESDGFKIECALFGTYVDELNSFLASGDLNNPVVFVFFSKVKSFQGKTGLQNAIGCTKLVFNPDCPMAVNFRKRMSENSESPTQGLSQLQESPKISVEDDFLVLTPRMSIEQMKKCTKDLTCVIMATIKQIIEHEEWWYTACTCNKAVFPDSKMFYCGKCNRHVLNVIPRFRIKVEVNDDNDSSATFVIFDQDASYLLNKSCAEMIEIANKDAGAFGLPNEISDLVNKTFLFKVEFKNIVNSRFDQSYSVKKVCNDPVLLQKFKDLITPSKDASNEGDCLQRDASNVVVDLMPKFCDVEVDSEVNCGDKVHFDLSKESDDLTLAKRLSADGHGD